MIDNNIGELGSIQSPPKKYTSTMCVTSGNAYVSHNFTVRQLYFLISIMKPQCSRKSKALFFQK